MAAGGRPGDLGAVSLLSVYAEVAGCPTVCRHCWAQGVGYGAMLLADIEWVLEEAHRFCDGAGLAFDAYPMHEMAAHSDGRGCSRCSISTARPGAAGPCSSR
jgi:hypothetical protein